MARTLVLLLVSATLLRAQGYMTQIVDGGGWNTTITVVNTSDFAEQVTVSFFDDGGNALTLGIVDPRIVFRSAGARAEWESRTAASEAYRVHSGRAPPPARRIRACCHESGKRNSSKSR